MAAVTILWTKGAASVELPIPDEGSNNKPVRNQIVNGALGGRTKVSNLDGGVALRRPVTIHFELLEAATLQDAIDFLDDEVNRIGDTFTQRDWDNNTYTVRYIEGIESFHAVKGGEYQQGTFILWEEPT